MRSPGRATREAARTRGPEALDQIFTATVLRRASWLRSGETPPPLARHGLRDIRTELTREARTRVEAAWFGQALHEAVDAWNAEHPGKEIAAPGAITLIHAAPPAWMPRDFQDLRVASTLRARFDAACVRLPEISLTPERHAGLVLASAVFDGGCLAYRDLRLLALWLAELRAPLHSVSGAPPWIDLKDRGGSARAISGVDAQGPYALRRLFLDRRTLELILWYDNSGGAARRLTRATAGPKTLMKLIVHGIGENDSEPRPSSRRFLAGARFLREADRNGPDHATALLAARRMETFAATPESWAVALTGPAPRQRASGNASFDPGQLIRVGLEAPPVDGRPVPETAAFFRLRSAIHPGHRARADLTTPDAKLTRSGLDERLRALEPGPDWPDGLRLARDWYLHLLGERRIRATSLQRYETTLGAAFAAAAGQAPLRNLAPEDLEELYAVILDSETRGRREHANLRNRLRDLHEFAVADSRWVFPELDPETFSGEGAMTHIRAALLARPEIDAARGIIRTGLGLAPDVARAAEAAFLLASRCATRMAETTKALLEHLEDAPCPDGGPSDRARPDTLFIRPSRFGDNKTRSAFRQIQPFALMIPTEADSFAAYLGYRRRLSPRGPLFGVQQRDGSVAPFDRTALGRIFAEALRRATGLGAVSAHSLRRAALTCVFLAIHEANSPGGATTRLLGRLSGWSPAERARIAETVAPATMRRDRWKALARFAGHGDAETTFSTYVVAADLAIFDACARHPYSRRETDRLLAAMPVRHVRFTASHPDTPSTLDRANPDPGLTPSVEALLAALELIDGGYSPEVAASAALLPARFLRDRIEIAHDWAALSTRRGRPRLRAPGRSGALAPDPLPAPKRVEALNLARRLVELAETRPDQTRSWIRATLGDASLSNAGQRLGTPAAFREWLATALALRPADRWQADRVEPKDIDRAVLRPWAGIRPDDMHMSLRTVAVGARVVVRVRLLGPNVGGGGGARPPADSWAGCIRFAAHLCAIFLALPHDPESAAGGTVRRGMSRKVESDISDHN